MYQDNLRAGGMKRVAVSRRLNFWNRPYVGSDGAISLLIRNGVRCFIEYEGNTYTSTRVILSFPGRTARYFSR